MNDADRRGGSFCVGVSWGIGRLEMGVERDWSGGELWDRDVDVGGDAGAGSVHVCDRTVERGPRLVR